MSTLRFLACGLLAWGLGYWETDAEAKPDASDQDNIYPATLCPSGMAYIASGSFRMGCPGTEGITDCGAALEHEVCGFMEIPAHDVTLSAFCIDCTEVTGAAYEACVEEGGPCAEPNDTSRHPKCNWKDGQLRAGREQHPINCLSWIDAEAYCRWRTGCEGEGCGLPSEAQWEFAARGPGDSPRTYAWGEAAPDCALANLGMYSGVYEVGMCVGTTAEVCSTPAGNTPDTGLCDMTGNVAEATRDYYHDFFYGEPAALGLDPVALTESAPVSDWPEYYPPSPARPYRGGSYYDTDDLGYERASARSSQGELERTTTIGFRCVAPPLAPDTRR